MTAALIIGAIHLRNSKYSIDNGNNNGDAVCESRGLACAKAQWGAVMSTEKGRERQGLHVTKQPSCFDSALTRSFRSLREETATSEKIYRDGT